MNDMTTFTVKRQFGQLVGTTIRTFDSSDVLVCVAQAKGWKLKEEVNFFSDEGQTNKVFGVKARSIIDLGATYDILDLNGVKMGALKQGGLKSTFISDTWYILDQNDQQIGEINESNTALGLIRRWIDFAALLFPQTYNIRMGGAQVATLSQRRNPFTVVYDYQVSSSVLTQIGTELAYAIPSILGLIEARQN